MVKRNNGKRTADHSLSRMIRKITPDLSGQSFRAKKLFVYGGYVNAATREKQDGKAGGCQVNRQSSIEKAKQVFSVDD
jgi:hypothetical protein